MTFWVWAAKLAAAVGPALLLLLYFHERTGARVAGWTLGAALFAGTGAAFAALGIEMALSAYPQYFLAWLHDFPLAVALGQSGKAFAQAYVKGGVAEEGIKLLALAFLLRGSPSRYAPDRIVIVSIAVACAFAGTENAIYFLVRTEWAWTAVFRTLLSLPSHLGAGAIMAFFLVVAGRGGQWRWALALAFAVPAFLHGTGNYLIALSSPRIVVPGQWKILANQVFAVLMVIEILLAVGVAHCAGRMAGAGNGSAGAAAGLWRGHLGMRRLFWSIWAVLLAMFAAVSAIVGRGREQDWLSPTSVVSPGVLGTVALLFAVLFWIHGRAGGPRGPAP